MVGYGSIRRHIGAIPFELVMIGGAIVTASHGNWKHFTASVFSLLASFLPLLIERRWKVNIPAVFQLSFVGFIFASLFSGEVLDVYNHVWWWDNLLHFLSSLFVGFWIMMWLTILSKRTRELKMPHWFSALFVMSTALMVTIMWEIAEFASDELLGTFSQGADLLDTMMDLVYESISAAMIAMLWWLHLNGKHVLIITPLLKRFKKANS